MFVFLLITVSVATTGVKILSDGLPPETTERERGITVWMTGISGSGKTTIAAEAVRRLMSRSAYRLDGDNLRQGLTSDLGFSAKDRTENNRRAAEVAKLLNDAGVIVICALISPYEVDRAFAREIHELDGMSFMEVFVDAPLTVTESRDPKGLYRLARSGAIKEFTGITSPFEAPKNPDLHIRTDGESIDASVEKLVTAIEQRLQKDACSKKSGATKQCPDSVKDEL